MNSASLQNQKNGYFLFSCKRSGACTQRSRRAKGCKAYVSFKKRTDWLNKLVIVERLYTIHSGHDPSSSSEGHLENISQELVKHIQDLISLGVKPDTILLKSREWSKEQGHTDLNNRAYFVTPKDIENIRTCMIRKNQQHKDDATSTSRLLEGLLKTFLFFISLIVLKLKNTIHERQPSRIRKIYCFYGCDTWCQPVWFSFIYITCQGQSWSWNSCCLYHLGE